MLAKIVVLSQPARLLLELVCVVEDDDRWSSVFEDWLPHLWRARGEPGPPPPMEEVVKELTGAGMIGAATHTHGPSGARKYWVDRAVEEMVRKTTDRTRADEILKMAAAGWAALFLQEESAPGSRTVRAGVGAAVYWRRLGHAADSFAWLREDVLPVARLIGEEKHVLPHMELSAKATGNPRLMEEWELLRAGGGFQARRQLAELIEDLAAKGELLQAVGAAEALFFALYGAGQLADALATARTAQARIVVGNLGPSLLAIWGEHALLALLDLGRYQNVTDELPAVLAAIDEAARVGSQPVLGEEIRDIVLDHGVAAAKGLRDWPRAREISSQLTAHLDARGAEKQERARYRAGEYAALLELGDANAAEQLLAECQRDLPADDPAVAHVVGARAVVASHRGDHEDALRLGVEELRLLYAHPGGWLAKARAHRNVGNHLLRLGRAWEELAAHWMAAALIYRLLGNWTDSESVLSGLTVLVAAGQVRTPRQMPELSALLERTDGVAFAELVAALREDPADVETALAELVAVVDEGP
jgi:tetratricopeptide (TPR) repeat protein